MIILKYEIFHNLYIHFKQFYLYIILIMLYMSSLQLVINLSQCRPLILFDSLELWSKITTYFILILIILTRVAISLHYFKSLLMLLHYP